MHIAFIDIAQSYTADRPDGPEPFGGTNTAVCFLARELVKAGVACTFFNKVDEPQSSMGITSMPIQSLIDERANPAYTAFVFCGRWVEWLVNMVREKTSAPLIAWMHESVLNQPFTPALAALDAIVFVSDWQACINQPLLQPHWKQAVIRNAMNPVFATLFDKDESVRAAKQEPPILIYAGATPRGLLHIPVILESLRQKRSDFSVEIFCRVAPTHDEKANEIFAEQLRGLPNVTHVGAVGQGELARRMRRASVLVAPNPWPETSCITMIEAMAAGLCVISSNRAALPETAADHAALIPVADADHPILFNMPMPVEFFARAIDEALSEIATHSNEFENKLKRQITYFTDRYQWGQRVKAWVDFLQAVGHRGV